ncbi:hypothetical protein KGF56_003868 [Candida oxycetoniae]|uniref:Class II aldolase/adducin N-terminal domain-containing protein n=1 Tax=Candida oxycetoniae TaxID=497107 RepID=A0AAI9WX16_9ASCO|nr:uncharacterized protein KGF56_003868 [Candida oxycetoniae]KAI3403280.2 hypothetical protein KGF56_003868 [Candida oxycetoniae]
MPESTTSPPHTCNSVKYKFQDGGSQVIAKGGVHPYQLPVFANKLEEREWSKQHMAGAFRVFARKGYTEGTAGHISIRDPVDPSTFWINPLGKHFGLIKASDLVHVDHNGAILPDGNQCAINAAGFAIHSAVHKHRPDVHAACHTHSTYGKAWSCMPGGKQLAMINQDVCTFYKSHSVYEDFGGVALEAEEGEKIAQALGPVGKGMILSNHGLLTVGSTVDEAAYLFTLLEKSCQVQLVAQAALLPGEKFKLIDDEVARYCEHHDGSHEMLYTEFQPDLEMELYFNDDFMQ